MEARNMSFPYEMALLGALALAVGVASADGPENLAERA
jgi:hypothetical protein